MEALLSVLPNLSIGVISIIGLVYVVIRHDITSDKIQKAFVAELAKREETIRVIEKEFRTHMAQHINSSTEALKESTKVIATSNSVIERAMSKLDGKK